MQLKKKRIALNAKGPNQLTLVEYLAFESLA